MSGPTPGAEPGDETASSLASDTVGREDRPLSTPDQLHQMSGTTQGATRLSPQHSGRGERQETKEFKASPGQYSELD